MNFHYFKNLIPLIFFFQMAVTSQAQLHLNEVCTQNKYVVEDEFGDTPDWIEIYNNGNTTIDLTGYFLSDDADLPQKWQFPNAEISPQSFLLIFASGKNLTDINHHTNFKLSKSGEILTLSSPTGEQIDQLTIPPLGEDRSFGKLPDGGPEWSFFIVPTPLATNDNGTDYQLANPPQFLTQQYFHETSATIELACDEPDCTIRFTRDGRIPNPTSELYVGPISLDTTTAIRAVTFSNTNYPSNPSTQTYFVETNHTLPVLALTSDPYNFWDWEEGIFMDGPFADSIFPHYGANYWRDVQIPIAMEFFENQELKYSHAVAGKIHGGKSARTKPMKSLRLLTDGEVPSLGMNYPFFENKNIQNFRRLVARNASGDFNFTHFRDAYLHRYFINENLDLDVVAHRPIVVYVNGIYYGVMNLREKIDRFYLRENHGIPIDSIDLLEEDVFVLEGTDEEYLENVNFLLENDLNVVSNFEAAQKMFDVSSLADFFIVQSYVNNTDFPSNNLKFWQPKKSGGKWRFLLFDMDVGMGRHGWTQAQYDNFNPMMENPRELRFLDIVLEFLENDNFRNYFVTRYADLMNTVFRAENLRTETERTVEEIDEEMKLHFQNWTYPGYDVWQNNRLKKLYTFIEERPAYQREFVRQYFELENAVELKIKTFPEGAGNVKINTIDPMEMPWDGYYYNGVPVELTIIPNNGFTFSHWESLHTISTPDFSQQIIYNFEKDDEITAFFETTYKGLQLATHPNPFQNEVQLSFTLNKISTVDIQLFDALGKLIQSFPQGKKNGGTHSISLKINDLHSGIYFISVQTEEAIQTKKLFKTNDF